MKILILSPINETAEYSTIKLMSLLNKENIYCISIPAYANYLKISGLAENESEAILKALISVKEIDKKYKDYIIIGNSPKNIKYDLIIEYNINHEEGSSIKDIQLAKMRETVGKEFKEVIDNYDTNNAESHLGGTAEQIVSFIKKIWKQQKNKKSSSIAMNQKSL